MKDFLIVGAGIYGSVMARELTRKGYSCVVIDKRKAVGGNIRTVMRRGIMVHEYGAHIFHTSDEEVWKYVTDLMPMHSYVHSPMANFKGNFYSLPFNMYTFRELFGTENPLQAKARIEAEALAERERLLKEAGDVGGNERCRTEGAPDGGFAPKNLEEQALISVGRTVYETLIKGYTSKQWGCDPRLLSPDIIKRIPIRFTYDNDYFSDRYEALPDTAAGGYSGFIDRLLEGIEVRLETDYNDLRKERDAGTWFDDPGLGLAKRVIYTGAVDEFFCFRFGPLTYRSLRFEHEETPADDFQGHAVVNYTDAETPYTRIIEHKHLTAGYRPSSEPFTIITKEYPKLFTADAAQTGDERYYPVRDKESMERLANYGELAAKCSQVAFGGRLGSYMYFDMDKVFKAALEASKGY